VDLAIIDII